MNSKRVVICDDEGITLMYLARSLERAGWAVVGNAGSGEQAVEIVLRERPDIVLMDFSMVGMNGIDASRHILGEYKVCILLLTGHDRADLEHDAEQAGISGFVAKPVLGDSLLEAISRAVEHFQGRRDSNPASITIQP